MFEGGLRGPQNPLFCHFRGVLVPLQHPLPIFGGLFLSTYNFVYILSFPVAPYFLFYIDIRRVYETFKNILFFIQNVGVLHCKICQQIGMDEPTTSPLY